MFTGLQSPTHLLILLVIILLFFGASRIPDLARSLGKGAREFREGIRETVDEKDEVGDHEKDKEKPPLEGAARGKILHAEEAGTTTSKQKP